MDHNFDLKGLWAQQTVATKPDIKVLIAGAARIKRRIRMRLILTNALLIATIIYVAYIGLSYKFQLATTRIGIILTILAMAFFVFASNGMLAGLLRSDPQSDNAGYLKNLLTIRKKQDRLQGVLLNWYYILLTIGVGCYMIEFLIRMRLVVALLAAAATFGWILFTWIYLRPKTINKQRAPLQELITRLQDVNEQLSDDTMTG